MIKWLFSPIELQIFLKIKYLLILDLRLIQKSFRYIFIILFNTFYLFLFKCQYDYIFYHIFVILNPQSRWQMRLECPDLTAETPAMGSFLGLFCQQFFSFFSVPSLITAWWSCSSPFKLNGQLIVTSYPIPIVLSVTSVIFSVEFIALSCWSGLKAQMIQKEWTESLRLSLLW